MSRLDWIMVWGMLRASNWRLYAHMNDAGGGSRIMRVDPVLWIAIPLENS